MSSGKAQGATPTKEQGCRSTYREPARQTASGQAWKQRPLNADWQEAGKNLARQSYGSEKSTMKGGREMRPSLTTKQRKAKCLEYRNGSRCGRVARHLVTFHTMSENRKLSFLRLPVCNECKDRIVKNGGNLNESSPKGFLVRIVGIGWGQTREYKGINNV